MKSVAARLRQDLPDGRPQARLRWPDGGPPAPRGRNAEAGPADTRAGAPRGRAEGPTARRAEGGHRPPASGAAGAGGRGARHGARAWQRARGAGGPTPRMATKTPLYILLYRFSDRRQWKMHCRIT